MHTHNQTHSLPDTLQIICHCIKIAVIQIEYQHTHQINHLHTQAHINIYTMKHTDKRRYHEMKQTKITNVGKEMINDEDTYLFLFEENCNII